MSKFQRIFKKLREQKNMTQEELAKALGVSKSTIGMYERGDREPNFEKLEVIADYFNVNMSDLIDSKNTASEMLPASKIGVRSHTVAERLNEVMTIRCIFIFNFRFFFKKGKYSSRTGNRILKFRNNA